MKPKPVVHYLVGRSSVTACGQKTGNKRCTYEKSEVTCYQCIERLKASTDAYRDYGKFDIKDDMIGVAKVRRTPSKIEERGVPHLTPSTDINLWDSTWTYSESDSVDALAKAAMRAYTQMARELGAKAPGDPKFLNKLEDRLLFKSVPTDVIDDVIFKVRLRGQQIDRREASKTIAMKELRVLVRSMLGTVVVS